MLQELFSLLSGREPPSSRKNNKVPLNKINVPGSSNAEFLRYFEKQLKPLVDGFEEHRQIQLSEYFKRRTKVKIGLISFALIAIVVWTSSLQPYFNFLLIIMIGAFGISSSWARRPIREFQGGIKHTIFPKLVKYFGDEFEFLSRPNWPLKNLQAFSILPNYDDDKSEDQIDGVYKGVSFRLMETHLTCDSSDSNARHDRDTVFKGMLLLFTFNKPFAGKTLVKEDRGVLSRWFKGSSKGMERVLLEDPIFEKQFDVYSTDQIESRYLLTPSFMERLLLLSSVLGGKGVTCSFYNNQILMMVSSSKNRFEAGSIFEQVTFEYETAEFFKELTQIFSVIETLKLNDKTHL